MKKDINDNILRVVVAAGCVIKKDGKYILVQEAQEICRGKWNLPAGRVEIGDTIKETAIKETKEETGYDVELIRPLGVMYREGDKAVKNPFEARIIGGELKFPKDEIMDARWFTFNEIKKMDKEGKLRAYHVLKAIEIVEKEKIKIK